MSQIDVRILGPVNLLVDAQELRLGGPTPRTMLAMLTINRRQVVSTEALANAVWDEKPPEAYLNSLQVFAHRLRRRLASAGVDPTVLRTVAPGYRLDISETECDVGRYAAARQAGRTAAESGDPAAASAHFQHALDQWSGAALADLLGIRYTDNYSTAMEDERLDTVSERISADLLCGKAADVIGELRTLTDKHPFRESLWGQLITALYLSGRQGDALNACRKVQAVLADELGIDPCVELLRLERQVLRQELILDSHPAAMGQAKTMLTTVAEILTTHHGGRLRFGDGRIVAVPPKGLRIGRDPSNDLELDDPMVSRHHAQITPRREGLAIKDLHSKNGVYVDCAPIETTTALSTGTEIQIGSSTMTFEEA